MFLAMNRFKIVKGKEQEFEKVWIERDTHLCFSQYLGERRRIY